MAEAATDSALEACRVARHLTRLFRWERAGGFARRRADVVDRLLQRRHTLVTTFLGIGTGRGSRSAALREAVNELAREIAQSRRDAEDRLGQLRLELRLVRGEGMASGLRGCSGGRVIGRG